MSSAGIHLTAALFGTFFLIVIMVAGSYELITVKTSGNLFGLWFASFWIHQMAIIWEHDNRH